MNNGEVGASNKHNFRYVIVGHVLAELVLAIALFFTGPEERAMLKWLVLVVLLSLIVQVIIYTINPVLFNDKIKKHLSEV